MPSRQTLSTLVVLRTKLLQVPRRDYESHKAAFGRRLRATREAAQLSQMDLARNLGGRTDPSQVSRWERGVSIPNFETLTELARVLEVSARWLEWGE